MSIVAGSPHLEYLAVKRLRQREVAVASCGSPWLNGKVVAPDINTGLAGEWQRPGPWLTESQQGAIGITSRGGAANFSGIEVWRKSND